MSRPKPKIFMEKTDSKTYKTEQVINATGIFAIFLKDKPINIRIVNSLQDVPAKYRKTIFLNSGHAFNLANRLNKQFKTTDYKVFQMTSWIEVKEEKEE